MRMKPCSAIVGTVARSRTRRAKRRLSWAVKARKLPVHPETMSPSPGGPTVWYGPLSRIPPQEAVVNGVLPGFVEADVDVVHSLLAEPTLCRLPI